ncbi:UNVERIFIED_ORG: ABC-type sugar transport system substrate-binding protein [Rhizobium aethiopicum]
MSGQEKSRLVRSLGEVAKALVVAWPTDDGEEYMAAVKTCLDAIYGNIPAKAARDALIRAAEAAGIPVIAVVH